MQNIFFPPILEIMQHELLFIFKAAVYFIDGGFQFYLTCPHLTDFLFVFLDLQKIPLGHQEIHEKYVSGFKCLGTVNCFFTTLLL